MSNTITIVFNPPLVLNETKVSPEFLQFIRSIEEHNENVQKKLIFRDFKIREAEE